MRHPLALAVKFYVECIQNHVWGPLGGREMSMCKTCILQRSFGAMTMGEKSVENYIEWYSLNTKRMDVGSRYHH